MQNSLENPSNTWQFQEAEDKFAELIAKAQAGQPQIVTRNDASDVVIVSLAQFYSNLSGWAVLRPGVLLDNDEVDRLFARNTNKVREVELE